jgi:ATP-dependent Lon protease
MASALASLASGRPIRSDLGMTGEITLRGKVLPIGGVKEKVLAAHRAELKSIILPKRNEVDLDEIPEEVKAEIDFIFVDTVADVLKAALDSDQSRPKTPRKAARPRKKAAKTAASSRKPSRKPEGKPARKPTKRSGTGSGRKSSGGSKREQPDQSLEGGTQ